MWESYIKSYSLYLRLERGLSVNTLEAYLSDVEKLADYATVDLKGRAATALSQQDISCFLGFLNELGLSAASQARILSGVKGFFKFLLLEEAITVSPAELIETPRQGRKLPDTLSHEEVMQLIGAIDRSKPEGERNRAMLMVLYACGLRVSELVSLRLTDLHFSEEFIRVRGKGDKERLVPISPIAAEQVTRYIELVRVHTEPKPEHQDTLFLNRRGAKLSRNMVFIIIKNLAQVVGIHKQISPHTFRHSFATVLVENGANLRAVQAMLGHASITTTEIYTHLDRKFLRDTIARCHPALKY